MSTLEEIRRKKLEHLRQQQERQSEFSQRIADLEDNIKPYLEQNALLRYSSLKTAYPEKAVRALLLVAEHLKSSPGMITDAQFRELLLRMEPQRRETRIKRV